VGEKSPSQRAEVAVVALTAAATPRVTHDALGL
jgi:hypothetical protein